LKILGRHVLVRIHVVEDRRGGDKESISSGDEEVCTADPDTLTAVGEATPARETAEAATMASCEDPWLEGIDGQGDERVHKTLVEFAARVRVSGLEPPNCREGMGAEVVAEGAVFVERHGRVTLSIRL
jgi:hypothetical protein